jgi:hypothetical protein
LFICTVGCHRNTEQEKARRQAEAEATRVAEQEAKEKAAREAQARKEAEVRESIAFFSEQIPLWLASSFLLCHRVGGGEGQSRTGGAGQEGG